MQLAAAVAADGDERQLVEGLAEVHPPGSHERDVDQPCAVAHQVVDRLVGLEAAPQLLVAGLEVLAELGDCRGTRQGLRRPKGGRRR
jgi:hypothetical protein